MCFKKQFPFNVTQFELNLDGNAYLSTIQHTHNTPILFSITELPGNQYSRRLRKKQAPPRLHQSLHSIFMLVVCAREGNYGLLFRVFAERKLAKRNLIKVLIVSGQCINTNSSDQTSPSRRHDFWHEYAYRWTRAKERGCSNGMKAFYLIFSPSSHFERAFLYSKFHDDAIPF